MLAAVVSSAAVLLIAVVGFAIRSSRVQGRIEDGVSGLYRYIDAKFTDHGQRIERLERWQDHTRGRRSD